MRGPNRGCDRFSSGRETTLHELRLDVKMLDTVKLRNESRTTRGRRAGLVHPGVVFAGALVATLVSGGLVLGSPGEGEAASEAGVAQPEAGAQDNGVEAMAALLKERAEAIDPRKVSFLVNDRHAEILGEEILQAMFDSSPVTTSTLTLRLRYARQLLGAGQFDECVRVLDGVLEDARSLGPKVTSRARIQVLNMKAAAYMRMAEEQNCHLTTSKDACLLPIRGGGVHTKRQGATLAIETLEEILSLTPDSLQARWLLNVAHMALGSYPEGVPEAFLIAPEVLASEYPLPRFDNVSKEAGVDVFGLSGGAVMEDFDSDGRLDLMISHLGLETQTQLFRNRGDGTFENRTQQAGIVGEVGGLNMVSTDYNNDGHVDVLILRGGWMGTEGKFPMSLLRNDGDGTFSDVTVAAGLLRLAPTQTAVWFDYDGDGWLDLFVGNESSRESNPCELFHNNGDGTFTDVAAEAGVDVVGLVKGVNAGDYDDDGRPDLYLSLHGGQNLLFHNDGPMTVKEDRKVWRFADVTAEAGVAGPRDSFGTFFFDYDNDGRLDLFVAGYTIMTRERDGLKSMAHNVTADRLGLPTQAERSRLYRNEGNGSFKDVTEEVGLYRVVPAMGLNFGDLDSDGFLDIYLGTGNPDLTSIVGSRMFRNDEGRTFQDVTTAGNFGHLQKGHAIGFGDLDNDGDQDVFAQMGGALVTDKAISALYKNPGNPNHWLGVELVGERSNRRGLGARLKVTVDTERGPRSFYRTVGSGGSFGANPFRQQLGLGGAEKVVSLEVFWPVTGETQRLSGLDRNQWYEIREGEEVARKLDRPGFALPDASDAEPESVLSVH